MEKTLCMFIVQVLQDTELFESVEFYWKDVLQMGWLYPEDGLQMIVQVYQDTEVFMSVKVYSGDVLKWQYL